MSEDLASLGIAVDSTQVVAGSAALDNLGASADRAATQSQILAIATQRYNAMLAQGVSQQQALAFMGDKFRESIIGQIQTTEQLTAATQARAQAELAAATEAASIMRQQDASFNAMYRDAQQMNKAYDDMRGHMVANAVAAGEAAAAQVSANESVNISSRAVRETISSTRYALEGNFTRAAGSATVLAQALGAVEFAFTPVGAAIVAVTLALGLGVVAAVMYANEMAKLEALADGVGRTTATSADAIVAASQRASDATEMPIGSAEKMAAAYVAAGQISSSSLQGLVQVTNAYAAATGVSAKEAQEQLTKAMQGNIPTIIDMNSKLGLWDGNQIKVMEDLAKSGNLVELQTRLLEGLSGGLSDTSGHVGGLAGSFQILIKWVGDAMNWLGRLETQVGNVRTALIGLSTMLMSNPLTAPIGLALGASTTQDTRNHPKQQNNVANAASSDAEQLSNGLNEYSGQITDLTDKMNKLKKDMSTPGVVATPEEQHSLLALTQTVARLNALGLDKNTIDHQEAVITEQLASAHQKHNTNLIRELTTKQKLLQLGPQVLTDAEAQTKATDAGAIAGDRVRTPKPKVSQGERYQDGTDKINVQAAGELKLADAYLTNEGAAAKLEATTKALADAEDKKITAAELAARILANTNKAVDDAILASAKQVAALNDETAVREKYNAMVAAGTISSKQAETAVRNEVEVHKLLASVANASAGAVIAVSQSQAQLNAALEKSDLAKETTDLNKQNEALEQQHALAVAMLSTQYDTSRQRAIDIAQLQETNRLNDIDPSLKNTAAGKRSITLAGQTAADKADATASNSIAQSGNNNQQSKINSDVQAYNGLLASGQISLAGYNAALAKVEQTQLQLNLQEKGGWINAAIVGLHSLVSTGQTTAQQLSTAFSGFFSKLENGFADTIGKAVTGSKNLGAALQSVAEGAVQDLISSLVKLGEQELIAHLFGSGGGIFSLLGGGGALGGSSPGLAEGGAVDGPGTTTSDSINVRLSKGEWVTKAAQAAKHAPLLEAINSGAIDHLPKFASGGFIGGPQQSTNLAGQGNQFHFHMQGANFGGADPAVIEQRFRKSMETEYGPAIVHSAVQQSLAASKHGSGRQVLNKRV